MLLPILATFAVFVVAVGLFGQRYVVHHRTKNLVEMVAATVGTGVDRVAHGIAMTERHGYILVVGVGAVVVWRLAGSGLVGSIAALAALVATIAAIYLRERRVIATLDDGRLAIYDATPMWRRLKGDALLMDPEELKASTGLLGRVVVHTGTERVQLLPWWQREQLPPVVSDARDDKSPS